MDVSARNGEILIIDEVFRELERKDDEFYKWVKQRDAMIVSIGEEVQRHVVDIVAKHPRLVDTKKNRSACDPWVIALARVRGLTVVTGEKATGNLKKPKIPDVCRNLGVPCLEIVDFFREQGWRW